MSRHILLLTLGPLQDFIKQARRTRDLWFGSHLMSEVSRAAALSIAESGGTLIFPAVEKSDDEGPAYPELRPCDRTLREDGEPPLAITNRILAEIPEGLSPREIATKAREDARRRWIKFANTVQHRCRGLIAPGADSVFTEQVATFLEIQAAFAFISETADGYKAAREAVEAALAGRKVLRDFGPWTQQRGGVPKSSLDGARETVLRKPKERDPDQVRRYRIEGGEQLDAIGLVKRAGGKPDQFVPIANIALASWIEAATANAAKEMKDVNGACGEARLGVVDRPDLRIGRVFGFDAEVFLEPRWLPMLTEAGYVPEGKSRPAIGSATQWGRDHIGPVLKKMRQPFPYVACIVADGDHMGDALGALGNPEHHRRFSSRLSELAKKARKIVEQEHRGSLVYAGGDDVLAFVCLEDALPCARALQRAFADVALQAIGAVPEAHGPNTPPLTLSVGIGVGHIMESMGDLLELGRRAELHAKNPRSAVEGPERNALAILIDKRSGGKIAWRSRWDAASGNPAERLQVDPLLEPSLSAEKVYEIHDDLRRMPRSDDVTPGEERGWSDILAADVTRTLARAESGSGLTPAEVDLDLDPKRGYASLRARIQYWIDRMLVARTFSEARRASTPRGSKEA